MVADHETQLKKIGLCRTFINLKCSHSFPKQGSDLLETMNDSKQVRNSNEGKSSNSNRKTANKAAKNKRRWEKRKLRKNQGSDSDAGTDRSDATKTDGEKHVRFTRTFEESDGSSDSSDSERGGRASMMRGSRQGLQTPASHIEDLSPITAASDEQPVEDSFGFLKYPESNKVVPIDYQAILERSKGPDSNPIGRINEMLQQSEGCAAMQSDYKRLGEQSWRFDITLTLADRDLKVKASAVTNNKTKSKKEAHIDLIEQLGRLWELEETLGVQTTNENDGKYGNACSSASSSSQRPVGSASPSPATQVVPAAVHRTLSGVATADLRNIQQKVNEGAQINSCVETSQLAFSASKKHSNAEIANALRREKEVTGAPSGYSKEITGEREKADEGSKARTSVTRHWGCEDSSDADEGDAGALTYYDKDEAALLKSLHIAADKKAHYERPETKEAIRRDREAFGFIGPPRPPRKLVEDESEVRKKVKRRKDLTWFEWGERFKPTCCDKILMITVVLIAVMMGFPMLMLGYHSFGLLIMQAAFVWLMYCLARRDRHRMNTARRTGGGSSDDSSDDDADTPDSPGDKKRMRKGRPSNGRGDDQKPKYRAFRSTNSGKSLDDLGPLSALLSNEILVGVLIKENLISYSLHLVDSGNTAIGELFGHMLSARAYLQSAGFDFSQVETHPDIKPCVSFGSANCASETESLSLIRKLTLYANGWNSAKPDEFLEARVDRLKMPDVRIKEGSSLKAKELASGRPLVTVAEGSRVYQGATAIVSWLHGRDTCIWGYSIMQAIGYSLPVAPSVGYKQGCTMLQKCYDVISKRAVSLLVPCGLVTMQNRNYKRLATADGDKEKKEKTAEKGKPDKRSKDESEKKVDADKKANRRMLTTEAKRRLRKSMASRSRDNARIFSESITGEAMFPLKDSDETQQAAEEELRSKLNERLRRAAEKGEREDTSLTRNFGSADDYGDDRRGSFRKQNADTLVGNLSEDPLQEGIGRGDEHCEPSSHGDPDRNDQRVGVQDPEDLGQQDPGKQLPQDKLEKLKEWSVRDCDKMSSWVGELTRAETSWVRLALIPTLVTIEMLTQVQSILGVSAEQLCKLIWSAGFSAFDLAKGFSQLRHSKRMSRVTAWSFDSGIRSSLCVSLVMFLGLIYAPAYFQSATDVVFAGGTPRTLCDMSRLFSIGNLSDEDRAEELEREYRNAFYPVDEREAGQAFRMRSTACDVRMLGKTRWTALTFVLKLAKVSRKWEISERSNDIATCRDTGLLMGWRLRNRKQTKRNLRK